MNFYDSFNDNLMNDEEDDDEDSYFMKEEDNRFFFQLNKIITMHVNQAIVAQQDHLTKKTIDDLREMRNRFIVIVEKDQSVNERISEAWRLLYPPSIKSDLKPSAILWREYAKDEGVARIRENDYPELSLPVLIPLTKTVNMYAIDC